jgi:hypothetical protein
MYVYIHITLSVGPFRRHWVEEEALHDAAVSLVGQIQVEEAVFVCASVITYGIYVIPRPIFAFCSGGVFPKTLGSEVSVS